MMGVSAQVPPALSKQTQPNDPPFIDHVPVAGKRKRMRILFCYLGSVRVGVCL